MPTVVAGRWRSAPIESTKGAIVPSTIVHSASDHTGALPSRSPGSDASTVSESKGKLHQGCTTAQKSAAKPSAMHTTERESRLPASRSPWR